MFDNFKQWKNLIFGREPKYKRHAYKKTCTTFSKIEKIYDTYLSISRFSPLHTFKYSSSEEQIITIKLC